MGTLRFGVFAYLPILPAFVLFRTPVTYKQTLHSDKLIFILYRNKRTHYNTIKSAMIDAITDKRSLYDQYICQ